MCSIKHNNLFKSIFNGDVTKSLMMKERNGDQRDEIAHPLSMSIKQSRC